MPDPMTSDVGAPDPFHNRPSPEPMRGGSDFGRLVAAARALQDRIAGARPPDESMAGLAVDLEVLAARFGAWQVGELDAVCGLRFDLPGRGHPFLLPLVVEEWTDEHVTGRVVFSRFHLGGNGAAHGGALPLLFDEVLGRLSNTARPVGRTAYLHVNYRHITRVDRELRIEATLDRIEGRKRWVTGVLWDDDIAVADAEGLFVELRPGQP